MANRFILKDFAKDATNNGVFGSYAAGTPTTTSDVDAIQSLPSWDTGWANAVNPQSRFPKLEEMQGLQYVMCKAIKEIYKEGIPIWDAGETYYQHSIVSFTTDNVPTLFYNYTGSFTDSDPVTDTTNWAPLISSGGGAQIIGQIIPMACSPDYVPEGCLPCDGTEYDKSQFMSLWDNYLTGTTPLLNTCTYSEYASDISAYGQCIKFAIDASTNKFKVPTIKNGSVLQQAMTDSELGKSYNAGLPNITGTFGVPNNTFNPSYSEASGALYGMGWRGRSSDGNDNLLGGIGFSASRSSSIYGRSATVQPNAVAIRFFIVVANGEVNESMMDWSAWASSLQGKANVGMDNITSNGKVSVASMAIPSYSTSGQVAITSPYVAATNGMLLVSFAGDDITPLTVTINEQVFYWTFLNTINPETTGGFLWYPMLKDDVVSFSISGNSASVSAGFTPFRSV